VIGAGIGPGFRRRRASTPYDIADFAPDAVLEGPPIVDGAMVTTGYTLSGVDVLGYVNPLTGRSFAPLADGYEARVSMAAPFGGYGAVETYKDTSSLRSTAGGSGPGQHPFYMLAVMSMPAITNNGPGIASCVTTGDFAAVGSAGIGSSTEGNQTWFGPQGASTAPFSTDVRFLEETYDGTSVCSIYVDGALSSYTENRTITLADSGVGVYNWFYGYGVQRGMVYFALWKSALPTWAERKQLLGFLKTKFSYETPTKLLVVADSIGLGHIGVDDGAPVECSTTDWPTLLQGLYADESKTLEFYNASVGGQRAAFFLETGTACPAGVYLAEDTGQTATWTLVERLSPLAKRNVVVISLGTNDVNGGYQSAPATVSQAVTDVDAATWYSRVSALVAQYKAEGAFVILFGIRKASGFSPNQSTQALLDAINALVAANAAGADRVVDVATLEPYVTPDNIHPDNATNMVIAVAVKSIVDGAGIVV
jgi:hypothetical protein